MLNLDTTVVREDGVTFVELIVDNPAPVIRRVRIESRIEGVVWPPRSHGVPESGWDETGVDVVLDPGERRALGYASDGPPVDPPVEVAAVERASRPPSDGTDHADLPDSIESSAGGVIRALSDPAPPADAVPTPTPTQTPTPAPPPVPEPTGAPDGDRSDELPAAVESWFVAAAERIERVEDLAEISSVTDAASAVDGAGGVAAAEELLSAVEADRAVLAAAEARADALRERGATAVADAPIDALRRLA